MTTNYGLNQLRDEIHQNAVDHGWWDEERSFAEIIALIHSELSEALEEYREGRPLVYVDDFTLEKRITDISQFGDRKPEGIAFELADTVIRILDYCGHEKLNIEEGLNMRRAGNDTYALPELVAECHYLISIIYLKVEPCLLCFAECISLIDYWCDENGIDLAEAIHIKHEYNKTRPHRHGGKRV